MKLLIQSVHHQIHVPSGGFNSLFINYVFFLFQGYIDASEDGFEATLALGNKMIDDDFEAKAEIADDNLTLIAKRNEMLGVWDQKKLEYDERSELQSFKRDIEQMEVIMVKQEVGY